jgi:hypothetical protein
LASVYSGLSPSLSTANPKKNAEIEELLVVFEVYPPEGKGKKVSKDES